MSLRDIAFRSFASQDHFELWQLLEIVNQINPQKILEIGVHRGGMIKTLHESFPQARIVGVDNNFSFLEYSDFEAVEGDSNQPETRDKVVDKFHGSQIDFLFIDGDHNYGAVKRDWLLYGTYVRDGGIVAFHDIMRMPGQIPGVEVRDVFDELKRTFATIEIWNGTLGENGPGIGVLFV